MFRLFSGALVPVTLFLVCCLSSSAYADAFEPDGTPSQSTPVVVDFAPQQHTFADPADADWMYLLSPGGLNYEIAVTNVSPDCDPAVECFAESDLVNPVLTLNGYGPGQSESTIWWVVPQGKFYIKLTSANAALGGEYDFLIRISSGQSGQVGWVNPLSHDMLEIHWHEGTRPGVTQYRLERSTSPYSGYTVLDYYAAPNNTYWDINLAPDTFYFYMIYEYSGAWYPLAGPLAGRTPLDPTPMPAMPPGSCYYVDDMEGWYVDGLAPGWGHWDASHAGSIDPYEGIGGDTVRDASSASYQYLLGQGSGAGGNNQGGVYRVFAGLPDDATVRIKASMNTFDNPADPTEPAWWTEMLVLPGEVTDVIDLDAGGRLLTTFRNFGGDEFTTTGWRQVTTGAYEFLMDVYLPAGESTLTVWFKVGGWGDPQLGIDQVMICAPEQDPVVTAPPVSPNWKRKYEGLMGGKRVTAYGASGNTYHPVFVDVDRDGDRDLFIGTIGDGILFYRNDGSPGSPIWTSIEDPDLAELIFYQADPALGDLDGDGDMDMLIGDWHGKVYMIRNTGTVNSPSWNYEGEIPELDFLPNPYAHPMLGDLDKDGDLDLLLSDLSDTYLVPNVGSPINPVWNAPVLLVDKWNGRLIEDMNGDSVIDLIGAGWNATDSDLAISYGHLDGGYIVWSLLPVTKTDFPGQLNAWPHPENFYYSMGAIDVDGDSDLDLVAPTFEGLSVLPNLGGTSALVIGSELIPYINTLDSGSFSAPAFGDIDGDGDQDMLLGDQTGRIRLLRNEGSAVLAAWENPVDAPLFGGDTPDVVRPWLADLDTDGDLDLLCGGINGTLSFYRNTGDASSPSWSYEDVAQKGIVAKFRRSSKSTSIPKNVQSFMGIDVGFLSAPAVADMNGDGLLDLLVGSSDGTITFHPNTGTPTAPTYSSGQTGYAGVSVGGAAMPCPLDMNGDGTLDLLVGSEEGYLHQYLNTGTTASPVWVASATQYDGLYGGNYSIPTLVDIDGDGDRDMFLGSQAGGVQLWLEQTPHLSLTPRSRTLLPGENVSFTVTGASGALTWSYVHNRSGAVPLVPSGTVCSYVAGPGTGVMDVIEVVDAAGLTGRTHVNVISSSEQGQTGKAILVAGRKAVDDTVWPASNSLVQQAYETCLFKGFDPDNIEYLSPVSGPGVDRLSTLANLSGAIASAADASELTIYMVDHGHAENGQGIFRLNEFGDLVTGSQLDAWLDSIQATSSMKVTLIIDCCKAGAFLPALSPPAGKERVLIAASADDELTYFLGGGQISFSEAFWNSIFTGASVGESYEVAVAAMSRYQTPQLDDSGDGIYRQDEDGALAAGTHIGLANIGGADRPQIGQVIGNQVLTGADTLTLWAGEVSSTYPIDEVWAVIVPPDFQVDPDTNEPIIDLPVQILTYTGTTDRWEADYTDFVQTGTYKVVVYARDVWGSVSLPKQIYVHRTDFQEEAIVVVGEGDYGPGQAWVNSNKVGTLAYLTLLNRWFSKDDITYLNSLDQDVDGNGLPDDVDGLPNLANLAAALTAAATAEKITVYLIGQGTADSLALNSSENLTASQLDGWLDTLQNTAGAEVYLVLECRDSGSFADNLVPPAGRTRVVMTSAAPGFESYCHLGGTFSFSHFFLSQVFEGTNLRDAFLAGRPAMTYLTGGLQDSGMTDDGDGILNEKTDGTLSKNLFIGPGFLTGGDDLPEIARTSGEIYLSSGQSSALLWCSRVLDSDGIRSVTATIVEPAWAGSEPAELPLGYNASPARYEGQYSNFTLTGAYPILFTAEDGEGNLAKGELGTVYVNVTPTPTPAPTATPFPYTGVRNEEWGAYR